MESFRYYFSLNFVLRTIAVIALLVGIFGYAWYADLLPFDSQSDAMSPSIENLQQNSNVITPDGQQIIYYSYDDVVDVPDPQIPIDALNKAIKTWEQNNPNLKFIESENSNIE